MKKVLLAVALIACATPAIAADNDRWAEFNQDSDGSVYAIDMDTLKLAGPNARDARVWVREDASKNAKKRYRMESTFISVNCVERSFRILQSVRYATDGSTDTSTGPGRTIYMAPDSIISFVGDVVCTDPSEVS